MHYCNHKFTYDISIVDFMILIIKLKNKWSIGQVMRRTHQNNNSNAPQSNRLYIKLTTMGFTCSFDSNVIIVSIP